MEVKITAESDHDILVRMDTRQEQMAGDISSLKKALYGEDGQGGICGRMSKVENQQSRWLGRDGVILILVPIIISVLAIWFSRGA